MLIVSPPDEEIIDEETVYSSESNSILDFNDLDIDYLEEDFLAEDELEFTELDINYLDVNFLEDLLDVIDALEVAKEEDVLVADVNAVNIRGTKFGQDLDTQITTFFTAEKLTLLRSVNNTARVDIDGSGSYTVIFIQDGVSRVVTINGGSNSTIKITQDN